MQARAEGLQLPTRGDLDRAAEAAATRPGGVMTDRIVRDPHPGIVDRIAESLQPRLLLPSQATLDRQHEIGPEAET